MIPLAAFAMAGCLAVSAGAGHILAGDLAPVFPALAAAAPGAPVSPAPLPGFQRIFRGPELRRLALRWNTTPAPEGELCFERPVAPLDPADIRAAMQKQLPEAEIELLEFSRVPVPRGETEFPLSGLRSGAAGAYWNGWVRYGGNRRFLIWAKVKAVVKVPRVIAVEALQAGAKIEPAQLRVETRAEFPGAEGFAADIAEVAGRIPLRSVAAGTPLRKRWLDRPRDVVRGDTVIVEVREGGAHVELSGRAEASGSAGQTIPVRNLASQKLFPARVEGRGRVSLGKGIQ